jgi:hypothetical protein
VNSQSDLFHDDIPDEFIASVFASWRSPRHTFKVLTKRPARMRAMLNEPRLSHGAPRWPKEIREPAVNLPTSRGSPTLAAPERLVRRQRRESALGRRADPAAAETPAAVRFLSCEPLLGPLDIWNIYVTTLEPCCTSRCAADRRANRFSRAPNGTIAVRTWPSPARPRSRGRRRRSRRWSRAPASPRSRSSPSAARGVRRWPARRAVLPRSRRLAVRHVDPRRHAAGEEQVPAAVDHEDLPHDATLADVQREVRKALETAKGINEGVYTQLDAYLDLIVPEIERRDLARRSSSRPAQRDGRQRLSPRRCRCCSCSRRSTGSTSTSEHRSSSSPRRGSSSPRARARRSRPRRRRSCGRAPASATTSGSTARTWPASTR